ncbi:MAG: Ig-like domain-containing protein, partial [Fuerstiella sp.]|nr:Ig-like domain-containing protein [Fuerstiella sp.]
DGWSVSWDTTTSADGNQVITATATDTASQTAASSVVNVIVDNTAPVISIAGPAAGSTESGTITVSALANDATSDVTQVEFFVNGSSIGVDTNASDGWSAVWNSNGVSDGTYSLTATVTDSASQTASDSIQITVDNIDELPTVSVLQPTAGALLANIVTVTASANDDKGVQQVEFFAEGNPIGVDTNASDGWSVSWDTTTGADGAHVITATATDTASQTAGSSVVNVTVDNTAPVISISGPAGGSTESGTITVSASANDATSDVAQVEFFVNGNSIGVDTNTSDGWSVPWDTTTVTNGTYDLSAQATDTAGNSSTATTIQITVDNIVSLQLVTYFSLQNNSSIGGLTIQNEDIIAWDGTSYSLYFDGTPYLSSVSMAAFTVLNDTQILMSFNEAGSVTNDDSSVVTFDDSDLLLFTAISLGSSTSGRFELYFDGSDVGLTRGGEDIDGVSIDPDTGDLLISTRGNHNVPGLSGSDEDILQFTSTSLGSVTSGSWTTYFDGSDVGLGDSSNEDVDGFAILNDRIYVTTRGSFSVPGISGNDQQIFVFNPTSLGAATAGSYDPLPHFDALSNDIRGLDVRTVSGSLTAAVSDSSPASSPATGSNTANRHSTFESRHSDRNQTQAKSETKQPTVIPDDELIAATAQERLPEFVWFYKYTDDSDTTKDKTDSDDADGTWHDFSNISRPLELLWRH